MENPFHVAQLLERFGASGPFWRFLLASGLAVPEPRPGSGGREVGVSSLVRETQGMRNERPKGGKTFNGCFDLQRGPKPGFIPTFPTEHQQVSYRVPLSFLRLWLETEPFGCRCSCALPFNWDM